MKKIAIFFCLNNLKALRPRASESVPPLPLLTGQTGMVSE